jgi:hypothetical protein
LTSTVDAAPGSAKTRDAAFDNAHDLPVIAHTMERAA